MKWNISTSRHKVSSWRELWSGEWSQQPRLRPGSMSWAPSEAKPTVSTVLVAGEISSPLLGTKGPSWRGAPEEARQEGILNLGTILCPATAGQWEVVEPGPSKLSPGLPGAERSGKKIDLAGLHYTTSERSGPFWQSMLHNFLSRPLSFLDWTTAMLF